MQKATIRARHLPLALALALLACALMLLAPPTARAWAADDSEPCGWAYLEQSTGESGTYTLVIQKEQRTDGGAYQDLGKVPANASGAEDLPWYAPQERREKIVAVKVDGSTGPVSPTSLRCWFYQCWNARSIDLGGLDSSSVTDMAQTFLACESLRSLDLSGLDTSNVADMSGTFAICSSLELLDLSGLDTSNVTTMAGLAQGCHSLESAKLADLNTSRVTDMSAMFASCFALSSVDLTGIDTSHVTRMDELFRSCSSLVSLDLSSLDTAAVTDISYMFDECSSLASVDVSSFDFLKIKTMNRAFSGCVTLEAVDMSRCGTESATWHQVSELFRGCRSLSAVAFPDAGEFAVSTMQGMFKGCTSLTSLDLGNVKLPSNPNESSSGAFTSSGLREVVIGSGIADASVLEGLFSLSTEWAVKGDSSKSFDAASAMLAFSRGLSAAATFEAAGDAVGMFAYEETATHTLVLCPQRKSLAAGEREFGMIAGDSVPWAEDAGSIEKVRIESGIAPASTASWFEGCTRLATIEGIENLDTSDVSDMSRMFYDCRALAELDMAGFDTSSAVDLSFLFYNCKALRSLELGNFRTARVTSLRGMFSGCSSLASIDVGGFNTSRVNCFDGMFSGCSSLAELDVSGFSMASALSVNGMFASCSALSALDLSRFDMAKASDLRCLLSGCSALTSLELFDLDNSRSRELDEMLSGCSALREVDISGFALSSTSVWNTPITFDLEKFFAGCSSLESVKVSDAVQVMPVFPDGMWAAGGTGPSYRYDAVPADVNATYVKVADKPYFHALLSASGALSIGAQPIEAGGEERLFQLFDEGYANAVDVPWHEFAGGITSVTVGEGVRPQSTAHWFESCAALERVDLSGLDTSQAADFSKMFYGCSSLVSLDLSGFDTRNATSMKRMLHECRALEQVTLGPDFTFRGAAWSRLAGSELPVGAWRQVGGDEGRAYASDSLPSFAPAPATYVKVPEADLAGYTIESLRGDTKDSSRKYTIETELTGDGEGGYTAEETYIIDDDYGSDIGDAEEISFVIGDSAQASSTLPTITGTKVKAQTVRRVITGKSKIKAIVIGPRVESIEAYAFKDCKDLCSLQVRSTKLKTQKSVAKCLAKSEVRVVSIPTRYVSKAAKANVKKAFMKWSKPKRKCTIN